MATMSAFVNERADSSDGSHARVISNFAWQHFKAATTFRNHVVALENGNAGQSVGAFFEDIRSYGSACITSAASSVEALINEFFINPEGPLRRQISDFETAYWARGGIERKPTLEKYQLALDMLGKPRLDEQSSPFIDAEALIELRHVLVHFKPTWDPDRRRKTDLIGMLTGKYKLSPFPDGGADFVTMRSMSADCMRWVTCAVLRFLREFDARARLDDHKMAAFWRFEEG